VDKGKSSSGRRTADSGGEVFQIATGVETSIIELAEMVQEVVEQNVKTRHGPPRQGDIRKNDSGIRKVERVLGWRPEVDLSSGLRKTWAWFEA